MYRSCCGGLRVQNRFFGPEALRILLAPQRWRLVSSLAPAEAPQTEKRQHRAWMRRHHHAHPYAEIMIVLEGEGWHGARGEIRSARPGTVFYFAAGEEHDVGCPRSAPDFMHL